MTDAQKEEYAHNLSIPLLLELGAYDGNVIALIRLGVTRSVAIEIGNLLPENF
jgi:hypothetical protein